MKQIVTAIIIGTIFNSNAQDIHFSQMEFTPLNLNPGLCGANAKMQGIVNYRNQWKQIGIPYNTLGASFDMRYTDKNDSKGILAGGINFFNDQSGNLSINTSAVNLHLAYHLMLSRQSKIGLGLYSGIGQRFIDPNAGRWGTQYDGTAYNPALSNDEPSIPSGFSYFDVGTGIVYTFKNSEGYMTQNNQKEFQCGAAVFHVNNPKYSYIGNGNEKLYARFSFFSNASIGINNSKSSFMPGVYYQKQGKNSELIYGGYYKYILKEGSIYTGFNKPMALHMGIFNRHRDALIAKLFFEWNHYSIGFAYDINTSKLSSVSRGMGGMEIFLRFNFNKQNH